LDAAQWHKVKNPLMVMNEEAEVYGPGHNTFARSPDGTEIWNIYHGTSSKYDGWNNRKARARIVVWDEQGMPILGEPLPLASAIHQPSGSGVIRAIEGNQNRSLSFSGIPSSIAVETPVLVHYTNDGNSAINASAVVLNSSEEYSFKLSP